MDLLNLNFIKSLIQPSVSQQDNIKITLIEQFMVYYWIFSTS
jgi:hypothetical protein